MSLKSFILQSLFVLLFCTSFLSAAPVDAHHGPFRLESYEGLEAYVGAMDYGHNTQITRQFLVSEAKRVWDFLPKTGGPAMVSALYTGDGKIYFGTSIKGPAAQKDLGFPKVLTDALHACRKERADQGAHVFSGRCAELMVIAEWYSANRGGHPNSHVQLPASGKLIVAVNYNREVVDPCSENTSTPSRGVPFGCADVLPKLGFTAAEIVRTDSESCQMRRRSFGGLTVRACVPKKPTGKPSPPRKPAPKKPTVQKPRESKPKRPSNNRPKPASPKMPAKPRARSNKRPMH